MFVENPSNSSKQKPDSYRGFASIDQEIEREIAMKWFTGSNKITFSQRSFLLKIEESVD